MMITGMRHIFTIFVLIIRASLSFFGTLPVSLSFSVLELNAFVKGAIEGFLSGLALLIFFAILPLVSTDRITCHVD